jgi:hypothetical protein
MKQLNSTPDIFNSPEFKNCLDRAKAIVAVHRNEAPRNFDPVNSLAGISVGGGLAIAGGLSAAGTIGAGLLQKKPNMPGFQAVDTAAEQRDAIKQNTLNFQSSKELADKTNANDQSSLDALLRKAIPGYESIVGQASKNIQSNLSGELSPDIVQNIQRSAAAKSLSGGVGGSGISRNLVARDLGISSMQLKQQGLNNAMNFIQTQRNSAIINPMSVSAMFLTPAQRINTQMQNSQNQFQAQTAQAQAQNQYDNRWAGAIGNIGNTFGGLIGGYAASKGASGNSGLSISGQNGGLFTSSGQYISNPNNAVVGAAFS